MCVFPDFCYDIAMIKTVTDPKLVDEVLDRGTIVEVLPTKALFREKLLSGDRVRMYIGMDATATTIHLSHAKNIMLLEKFRKLGHDIILLFGDFTARIGDPSGESATRKQLTRDDVKNNVDTWIKLIKPLMDFDDPHNPPRIMYNHDWLAKLTLEEMISLASNFTVQQMLERDMFEKRLADNKPIHLHEFLYPLMQGYDSVAMDVDAELCGTDQTFNALAGRTLEKRLLNKEKFVVVVTLMANPKTGELMSKSKGTGVFLHETPTDMYGQIMAQPDEMIELLLVNNTHLSKDEIRSVMALSPRDAKMRLALEIVTIFAGAEEAGKAQTAFVERFQKKGTEGVEEFVLKASDMTIIAALIKVGFVASKTEARKLMEQGGIKVDGVAVATDGPLDQTRLHGEGIILERGKLKVVRLIVR